MTNSQPEDISTRFNNIDEQLEQILDDIDLIRTVQNGIRRENRINSQNTARLERTVARLAEIATLHQQAFRIVEQDREELQRHRADIRQNQENINRILEYLENPNRGDTMPN
ncbi:MAG: hypothetical protein QNJ63_12460 [Calothrix sp. MO_192.B10]|nr:hypothetical protein [Calothrix sp. MO_192.B10]